ncbi:hypothetical protein D3C72_1082910 [compost metagenome]
MEAEHTFSHIHWNLRVYRFRQSPELGALAALGAVAESSAEYEVAASQEDAPLKTRWINQADMEQLAFPNVFLKILNKYFASGDEQE